MSLPFSRIVVTGVNGQIGSALVAMLGEKAIPLSRHELDLQHPEKIVQILAQHQPDAVINAAAYTAVDLAESEQEQAFKANGESVGAMAAYCKANGIPFVHYSTDYVFDGSGDAPRNEDAPTAPLNVYGRSKLAGEEAVAREGGDWLVFRTSWVYDARGKNFFNTMLRLGAEREELKIVADQHGVPCYAPHLASATLEALEKAISAETFPSGIYHMVHGGATTWHGFAEAIFESAKEASLPLVIKTVESIPSSAYPVPATRPLNSRLDCSKLANILGVTLLDWQEGLQDAMTEKMRYARD